MRNKLIEDISRSFMQLYNREPAVLIRAPGRVNLLGSHTDYNEGWVLPAAIDRAIYLAAAPNDSDQVRITSLDFGQEGQTTLADLSQGKKPPDEKAPNYTWLNYPAGVAWAMLDAGYELVGLDVVFAGDIPVGAGVSSSAAVEVAFIMAWEKLSGLTLSGEERARLGQKVENGYLGLASGIMDQFASIHGAPDRLILLDCRTLAYEHIPLPSNVVILVADSGVRHELANSEYNTRRRQCREGLTILQEYLPEANALRDVSPDDFDRFAYKLPEVLRRRARHVIEENRRVHEGAIAAKNGNMTRLGLAVQGSHASARDLYEISIPELDVMARAAWNNSGCYGARITGGGFGGCLIALVEKEHSDSVARQIAGAFSQAFDRSTEIFACQVGGGAELL